MTPFYRFASRGAIIPFLKLVSRHHVRGTENIPQEGGFIAVCNHLSDLDSLTAMRCLVDAGVPAYSLAKSTIFEVPVLGHVFKAGGQIPVYRGTDKAGNSLIEAERRLLAGDVIMIFPEGTLSRDPLKWPMTGKTGAARLAMATGVPILPMGQWGAQDILDSFGGGFHPFPRKDVRVIIEKPFTLDAYGSDTSDHEAVRAATAEIMRRITKIVEELRGEKAPRPYDMHYDGDPGKDHRGVRKPDPVPEEQTGPTTPADPSANTAVDQSPSSPETPAGEQG
ncbi:2-acyl-glycerophospho-ethanolamine acyltransferase [Actinomyces bovis]|uniref:2-acyl-glycerophospho-ethanolamine acyltransferase n=1 Tax=Actinomyces bovis TaxID=1658 RepID=A0ABY1VKH6_9ACTO|nr:lysophospholipid acyltransferase family protein [Actinomyces bovis]SPT52606.1 2-acyl-glycerophospho-ethanolamine acyltransferase [Actinomyces bovis]VEG54421.1 2-acyl-glycerophospho-ethanolamine acyltransferase [Actinomyces israelii]